MTGEKRDCFYHKERNVKAKDSLLSWIASYLAMTGEERDCFYHKERGRACCKV
jgi:hypothetical protein